VTGPVTGPVTGAVTGTAPPAPLGPVLRYDEVESTQRIARTLAEEGAADGTCVVARRQTRGRGRLARSWLGPEGGLFLSVILRPRCPPAHAPRVTLAAAAALVRACDDLGVAAERGGARVKWPNDLLVPASEGSGPDGRLGPFRKAAGALVEIVRLTDVLEACVLGVGVNVRPPDSGWPAELAGLAGSLAEAGTTCSADDVLAALSRRLPEALAEGFSSFDRMLALLRDRSATLGRRVVIDDPAQPDAPALAGEARALLDDGALLLVDDDGREHVVRAGDVWL
jgi:BirA family transcriptional regulator, biotin operon repressor / biotin---[acetyl-CoA-carboxylase] ligase